MKRNNLELNFNSDKLANVENQQIQDYNEPLKVQLENLPAEPQKFTPNNPPWNSGIAFLMWVASILFILVIPTFGVIFYVVAKGINITDSAKLTEAIQNDPNAILANIICVIPAHLLTILLAWLVVTSTRKHSFREMLGWQWGGFNIFYLVGIVIAFFIFAAILSNFIPEQDNDLLKILRSSRINVYFVAFMATFTAPLVEEVVYRGIMYSAFQRTFGVVGGVALVTFLFALVHVPQYYPSVATIIMICLLSLVLTLVRAKSENLLPCIILHTIFNGIQSLLMIAEPYLKQFVPEQKTQAGLIISQLLQ
ncbi:MAG: CPBP family intramembrane metalloprotease [Pyrinomonadaceae bacterium]|nr:CPBP family intramembrane metalloprotease [Pyrinomonadaceae bacterium]